MRRIHFGIACLLLSLSWAASPARAAGVKFERTRMKTILHVVAGEIEKNFYDEKMKGLDWKGQVQEAEAKIEKAETAGDMITAIFVLVNKLGDSHTMFLPPGRVNKPLFGFNAKAFGDDIMVYEVTKKGAAEKAGLLPGDRLLTVNGFKAERKTFSMMMLYYHILRPIDSLRITYARGDAAPQTLDLQATMKEGTAVVDLTEDINIWALIREVTSEKATYHYQTNDDGIAYLHVPEFVGDVEFHRDLLGKLKAAKAIVIDLRGDPGGAVNSLTDLAGYFSTTPDTMAHVKGRKKDEDLRIKPHGSTISGPMYVLVDSESASAAEMFARHFQRTGHAVVIGDKTSGRVNVARFYPEQLGADTIVAYGIEIAVGQVTFPDSQQLEGTGVTPDKVCLPTAADVKDEKDPCLQLAKALAREKLGLKPAEAKPGAAKPADPDKDKDKDKS